MDRKTIIAKQKSKDAADVLVLFTRPVFWEVAQKKNLAAQKETAPDTRHIAFLRTRLPDGQRSTITHVAEVAWTEVQPIKKMFAGLPQTTVDDLRAHMREHNVSIETPQKEFHLKDGSLVQLAHPIEHDVQGPVRYFRTTMSELLQAKSTKDLLKGRHRSAE